MKNISLLIISCLIGLSPLFGKALGLKPGVAYLSAGEVYFCDLDHHDTLRLTSTGHQVTGFALSPDKRFLAYSKIFKVVGEPGNWDSIVPQVPVCSIVMLDLKQHKIVNEIFPEEYAWLNIYYWVNTRQLLCELSSGFSVDDFYFYDTAGRVDTIGYEGWKNYRETAENLLPGNPSILSVIRDAGGAIHLKDALHQTDTVIFKESDHIHFEAITPDLQSFVWSETSGGYFYENNTMFRDYYHLYLKNMAANESIMLLDEKKARDRRNDKYCFSPDNSVISINWFCGDHLDLYFFKNNQLHTIEGQMVDWIDARKLMLVKDGNLYIYDIQDNTSVLFMSDVSKPQLVQ